jgi:hypothetical protein
MRLPRLCAIALLATIALPNLGSVAVAARFVPFEVQIPLVLKALTYDRRLKSRVSDEVRIAIVAPAKDRDVVADFHASVRKLPTRTVNGLPVTFKEVARGDDDPLDRELRDGRWAAVYTLPGFSEDELQRIRKAGEAAHVLLVAADAEDVERGLAFGVGADGGKPQIVVHLPRSVACGSDFDLAFLRLGRVIQ